MIWLIRFWQPIAAAILTGFIAFGLHSCLMDRSEKRQVEAVAAQKLQTEAQCIQQQKVTTDASNNYQNGLSSLERDLAGVMQPQSCIKLSTGSTASGFDAANGKPEPRNRDEINPSVLYGFAASCERDRLKVIGLQKFIQDERK